MATKETWVTTLDNPFDPFKDPENWQRFDEDNGYYTTSLICRYLVDAPDWSENMKNQALEEAVDKIVRYNFYGNYKKVVKED